MVLLFWFFCLAFLIYFVWFFLNPGSYYLKQNKTKLSFYETLKNSLRNTVFIFRKWFLFRNTTLILTSNYNQKTPDIFSSTKYLQINQSFSCPKVLAIFTSKIHLKLDFLRFLVKLVGNQNKLTTLFRGKYLSKKNINNSKKKDKSQLNLI